MPGDGQEGIGDGQASGKVDLFADPLTVGRPWLLFVAPHTDVEVLMRKGSSGNGDGGSNSRWYGYGGRR
jgi:hypothetical protein